MDKKTLLVQWAQLLVLTGVHFLTDMFAGMLPAIVPAIQDKFTLSLTLGFSLIVVLNLTCNGVQMLTGHMRANKTTPYFMHIGLVLAAMICLLGVTPQVEFAYVIIVILMVVAGIGIAITHPEALRAIHTLDRIAPAMTTAFFMSGGFLGYAGGGWIAAALVEKNGFVGLYPIFLCAFIGIALIIFLKIHLAVESDGKTKQVLKKNNCRMPFGLVMAMAIPVAVSTTIITWVLPSRLTELGFNLSFGGYSYMMFGIGAAIGSFLWAAIAHKRNELAITIASLSLGLPFLYIYFAFMETRWSVWLLFVAGFCSSASFPLIVTMARHAIGSNLGRRMGFSVGGSWLLATVLFLILSFLAGRYISLHTILLFAPAGYIIAVIVAIYALCGNALRQMDTDIDK